MSQYYNLNMTGPELTERLDKVLVNELAIDDEVARAQAVEATKANANDVYTKAQTDAAIDADVLVETTRAQAVETTKQGVIEDLAAIRSGAAKGATAIQQHQSLENYYTKTETNDVVNDSVREAVGMVDTSTLVLSPDVVLPNIGANVTITANTGETADITIRDNHHVIAEGAGTELVAVEPFIPTSEDFIKIEAVFVKGGVSHTVTARLLVVQPVKYGAGLTVASATANASARKTADGEYAFVIPDGGGYLWFCLPAGMKLAKALMTDVEMEIEPADTTTMPGYSVYRSTNEYEEGTVKVLLVGSDPYND